MKENYKSITNKLLHCFSDNSINQITIKPLFGGSGICYDDVMFAWIYDNKLYLRGHSKYLAMFLELNMTPLAFDTGVIVKLLQYYQVTEPLWENEKKLLNIIQMVIKHTYLEKLSKRQVKESRIKDLPNMNLSLERSLFRAGIINLECFRTQGPHRSYLKLKRYNKRITINVLYILHCALKGTHVATLSEEQKMQLKNEYNELAVSQEL